MQLQPCTDLVGGVKRKRGVLHALTAGTRPGASNALHACGGELEEQAQRGSPRRPPTSLDSERSVSWSTSSRSRSTSCTRCRFSAAGGARGAGCRAGVRFQWQVLDLQSRCYERQPPDRTAVQTSAKATACPPSPHTCKPPDLRVRLHLGPQQLQLLLQLCHAGVGIVSTCAPGAGGRGAKQVVGWGPGLSASVFATSSSCAPSGWTATGPRASILPGPQPSENCARRRSRPCNGRAGSPPWSRARRASLSLAIICCRCSSASLHLSSSPSSRSSAPSRPASRAAASSRRSAASSARRVLCGAAQQRRRQRWASELPSALHDIRAQRKCKHK